MIYLDHNASTPVIPAVLEAVNDGWSYFANPSSSHKYGELASSQLEDARTKIGSLLGAKSAEIIFTSGATEAAALAILGLALPDRIKRPNLVILATEHKAVIEAAQLAASITGGELRIVEVDDAGQIRHDSLESKLDWTVSVFCGMLANNETGVVLELSSAKSLCESLGIKLICDATQAVGKIPLPLNLTDSCFFFSGHKIGTPKGIGALVLPKQWQGTFLSVIPGGGQQRGIRGGTENAAMAKGLALALDCVLSSLPSYQAKTEILTSSFKAGLRDQGLIFEEVSGRSSKLSNTCNLLFPEIDGDAVLANLRAVVASTGSACNSANPEPSHVLIAMGYSRKMAASCIRFSFSSLNTLTEVDAAIQDVCQAVIRVQQMSKEDPK